MAEKSSDKGGIQTHDIQILITVASWAEEQGQNVSRPHPDRSFSLPLCGPSSLPWADAHVKHKPLYFCIITGPQEVPLCSPSIMLAISV